MAGLRATVTLAPVPVRGTVGDAGAQLGKEWRSCKSILDRWLDEQMLSEDSGFSHMRQGNNEK